MRSANRIVLRAALGALVASGALAATPSVVSVSPDQAETGTIVTDVSLTGGDLEKTGALPTGELSLYGAHYYEYLVADKMWHEASDDCTARGGYLASITSAEEDAFVWGLGSLSNRFIGLTDEATEGVWVWSSGEAFGYSHWSAGQPDNILGIEDYVIMWTEKGGLWNDISADSVIPSYVCEYETAAPPFAFVHLEMSGEADIVARNVRYLGPGALLFDVDLTGAATGDWDVVVTNPGGETGVLSGGFAVLAMHSIVPAPVTGLSAEEASATNIDLAWTNPLDANATGVTVFGKEGSAPAFVPTNGTSYTPGGTFGDADCVYEGTGEACSDFPLAIGVDYHYAVYTHDADHTYSPAASASARIERPYVASSVPSDSDSGVPVICPVEVTFSEPMNQGSVESVFTMDGVPGSFLWAGNVMTFTPTVELEYGTTYTVTIGATAADANGVTMGADHSLSFTTAPWVPPKKGCAAGEGRSAPGMLAPLALLALVLARGRRGTRARA